MANGTEGNNDQDLDGAASIADVVEIIKIFAAGLSKAIWKEGPDAIKPLFGMFFQATQNWLSVGGEPQWDLVLTAFKSKGLLDADDVDTLKSFSKAPWPIDSIMFVYIVIKLLATSVTAKTAPAMETMLQQGLAAARPTLPSAESAIHAAYIAPEKTAEVREYLARYGFSEKVIDLMFLAQYRLYDENTVRELWLRKIISNDKMFERMRELGYTDARIKEITEAWVLIPPVQDILTMVGREAFEPDSVKLMGLDDEFPSDVTPWLEKQGLSSYWQRMYWRAHWEQPSIQMGYEMLHRGIISREELEFLFKTVEIPPYWRPKLLAITYTPLTRVDVRRMHKLGVLDDAGVVDAYKKLGYDDENAALMGEFTKRANAGADKDLSKAEVLRAYKERVMTTSQCREFLVRMKYDEDEADFIIAMADLDVARETAKILQGNIETRYKGKLINRTQARNELDNTGMPATQRDALLAKWDLAIIEEPKVPSKTDMEDFYRAGIITKDTYRVEMERLGYSQRYIDYYAELAFLQGPKYGAEKIEGSEWQKQQKT